VVSPFPRRKHFCSTLEWIESISRAFFCVFPFLEGALWQYPPWLTTLTECPNLKSRSSSSFCYSYYYVPYLLTTTDHPKDIVCPCRSEHLPCCKNCTDGFAIPFEIKQLIQAKLEGEGETSTTDSSPETTTSTPEEGHNKKNPVKQAPAVDQRDDDETTKNNYPTTEVAGSVDNNLCVKIKGERAEEQRATTHRGSIDSDDHQIIISHALGAGHDGDIIVQVGSSGHKVTRLAMRSLKPEAWLKDEVINTFFHLLSLRDGELCKNDVRRKRNGFFNSFFMTKLLNEGHATRSGEYEYGNVHNWSTRFVPEEDIFKVDKLFFPINVERQHWVLAVADISNQKIQMYDSGQRYNYKSIGKNGFVCLEIILRYLKDEHLDKKKTPLPNANCWRLIPYCQSDIPQQSNGKFVSLKMLSLFDDVCLISCF
jgi:hypothetical protein